MKGSACRLLAKLLVLLLLVCGGVTGQKDESLSLRRRRQTSSSDSKAPTLRVTTFVDDQTALDTCASNLVVTDQNNDNRLSREEYMNFLSMRSDDKLPTEFSELPTVYVLVFYTVSCTTCYQRTADENCCVGSSSYIPLLKENSTESTVLLSFLCTSVDDSITDMYPVEPTFAPTEIPTMKLDPSTAPSFVQSSFPSDSPSSIPSLAVSASPSSLPSRVPSASPSSLPSRVPSASPSSLPSRVPSASPSSLPSRVPSASPSSLPSRVPSAFPSTAPTQYPTTQPSVEPSSSPISPSGMPSSVPSVLKIEPTTSTPTATPTLAPSASPSDLPTQSPSGIPSLVPSVFPSTAPTQYPTTPPSVEPSSTPISPSDMPSSAPTTSTPTAMPTLAPSASPSALPTQSPSGMPSLAPSQILSDAPSYVPTAMPTRTPSTCVDFSYNLENQGSLSAADIVFEKDNQIKQGLLIATRTTTIKIMNETAVQTDARRARSRSLLEGTPRAFQLAILNEFGSGPAQAMDASTYNTETARTHEQRLLSLFWLGGHKQRRLVYYSDEYPAEILQILDNPFCPQGDQDGITLCAIVETRVCLLLEEGDDVNQVRSLLLIGFRNAINGGAFWEAFPPEYLV